MDSEFSLYLSRCRVSNPALYDHLKTLLGYIDLIEEVTLEDIKIIKSLLTIKHDGIVSGASVVVEYWKQRGQHPGREAGTLWIIDVPICKNNCQDCSFWVITKEGNDTYKNKVYLFKQLNWFCISGPELSHNYQQILDAKEPKDILEGLLGRSKIIKQKIRNLLIYERDKKT